MTLIVAPWSHGSGKAGSAPALPAQSKPTTVIQRSAASQTPATPTPAPSPVPLTPSSAASAAASSPSEGEEGDDHYWPRSALSTPPQARERIDLIAPESLPAGIYRGELTLFIDDDGTVRRVRVENGNLPDWLHDIVRQQFLKIRFQAGERLGQTVRSRMRIEVEFETMRLSELLPQAASQVTHQPIP
ncbi:hypothetical protein [Leptothrix ochracea]|uniref:hypothetical protein n=1 Tax=Leptothrix ochracea TaxID=735331 RepID=UPI0012EAB7D9|nr:hypothetical protein [Leptothrix ochracea]